MGTSEFQTDRPFGDFDLFDGEVKREQGNKFDGWRLLKLQRKSVTSQFTRHRDVASKLQIARRMQQVKKVANDRYDGPDCHRSDL